MENKLCPDISIIILTYNEELHIKRCINNLLTVAKEIFIVDSYSTDKTVDFAVELGAKVYKNKWPGNQAEQFNWALENLPIKTEWVMRIDADEYLLPELIEEIKRKIFSLPRTVNGVIFKRRVIFLGKWIRRGTYPVKLLRLFRLGKAISEQKLMDEHIILTEGSTVTFDNDFVDENKNSLASWIEKHNNYSLREAIDLLDIEYGILSSRIIQNKDVKLIRSHKKLTYSKQPLFIRAFLYFLYRYIIKLGFLDKTEGLLWHFFQGFWYRMLVDAKLYEIKKTCGSSKEQIKEYINTTYLYKI